ncbi:histidine kinase N-terminal 7TM domain-containing protein [Daejeonella sp. H1SJ63]|uniref:sensor histidine kinase n=1 Tax=Daejeonella sp. H1SJ63 TaxID=3034145 RepID=UPI0023EDD24F|nr:histidine kinase N-terminal 7TM domain-containing protein [Daejeonella sp. H1SJ63]
MTFNPNIYSIILILCGLITFYMCYWIFRRYEIVVRWFGFMMLGIAIWALSYGFELSSSTLDEMLFWINIEYLGISFIPAFWLLFISRYTGRDKWLSTTNFILLMKVPVITLLLVWTNNLHHLHYKSVSVDRSGDFPLLSIQTGPWYVVHTVYFYLLLAWGVYLLIDKFRRSDPVFKKQHLSVMIAAFIPWIANIAYLMGFRPMGHVDSTPFAFIITALAISVGLVKFKLMDIIPVARDKVIDAMNQGLIVADSMGRIIDLNRESRKIFSLRGESMIGRNIDSIFEGQSELLEFIQKKKPGRIKIEIQKNGKPVFLEVNLSPLFEDTLIYSGLILLVRDITDQVYIENKIRTQSEQLQATNKLKDRLFSIISHDLRGPLINLNDIIKLLNEGAISDEEFHAFIPVLSRNIGYTTGLLENLLFWSRSQLQGEMINPVHFNLKEVCDNILHLFENAIAEKMLKVENNIDESCIVYADKDMIQLVMRNLISNAAKFSKRGGSIILSSGTEGEYSVICCRDTGVGISEANQKKLFEQETFTTPGTENEQGTGLGLLLCKDFVEKNGGTIRVESELNKGSKFCIKIPNQPFVSVDQGEFEESEAQVLD